MKAGDLSMADICLMLGTSWRVLLSWWGFLESYNKLCSEDEHTSKQNSGLSHVENLQCNLSSSQVIILVSLLTCIYYYWSFCKILWQIISFLYVIDDMITTICIWFIFIWSRLWGLGICFIVNIVGKYVTLYTRLMLCSYRCNK